MGFFDRVKRIVSSNVNSLLEKMEDPELAVKEAIASMEREHARSREAVAQAVVDHRKLEKSARQAEDEAKRFRDRAAQLVAKGDDAGAKEALTHHKSASERARLKNVELDRHAQQVETLKRQVDEMGRKIEEARAKQYQLVARVKATQTSAMASSQGEPASDHDPFAEFRKFEESVQEQETRTRVMRELSGEDSREALDRIEQESSSDEIDDELARLKKELDAG